jgi:hypothetical protein
LEAQARHVVALANIARSCDVGVILPAFYYKAQSVSPCLFVDVSTVDFPLQSQTALRRFWYGRANRTAISNEVLGCLKSHARVHSVDADLPIVTLRLRAAASVVLRHTHKCLLFCVPRDRGDHVCWVKTEDEMQVSRNLAGTDYGCDVASSARA